MARKEINYSQDTPKKTRLPIPDCIKGYEQPVDFQRFLTLILPNMREFISAHMSTALVNRGDLIDETISCFTLYMLGLAPTRNFVPRWTLYDPNFNNGRQPYYKWFLTQLRFAVKDRVRSYKKESRFISLSGDDDPDSVGFNLETVDFEEYYADPTSDLYVYQLEEYLSSLSERHALLKGHFEANALLLYNLRMSAYSNQEIAENLSISMSSVTQWSRKLKFVIAAFLRGDKVALNRFMTSGIG